MIVSPHARFSARNLRRGRNVIPSVGAMVDAMQQKPFVIRMRGEIGFLQQARKQREAGLGVVAASDSAKRMTETNQSLSGNGAGRGIDGLELVERIGRSQLPVAQTV